MNNAYEQGALLALNVTGIDKTAGNFANGASQVMGGLRQMGSAAGNYLGSTPAGQTYQGMGGMAAGLGAAVRGIPGAVSGSNPGAVGAGLGQMGAGARQVGNAFSGAVQNGAPYANMGAGAGAAVGGAVGAAAGGAVGMGLGGAVGAFRPMPKAPAPAAGPMSMPPAGPAQSRAFSR
jgi:hypothetical protein